MVTAWVFVVQKGVVPRLHTADAGWVRGYS
jgi:hypothetical protein